MSHKVHPKAFRIQSTTDWNSRGFYKKKLPDYLKGDFKIREFLEKKLINMAVERVEIERFPGKTNIIISSARPGLIIGRGGGGIDILKKEMEKYLAKEKINLPGKEIRIEIREIREYWASASLAAQWIASQIERRMPCRRVLKQALNKITANKSVQGARVEASGRIGGATIARREWLKAGKLPRQTIRAEIDFAQAKARCSYGVTGIKVWIYKGEKFK